MFTKRFQGSATGKVDNLKALTSHTTGHLLWCIIPTDISHMILSVSCVVLRPHYWQLVTCCLPLASELLCDTAVRAEVVTHVAGCKRVCVSSVHGAVKCDTVPQQK
eukprot:GHUV01042313.1.p2 GENE.GHUV01042313.1~~GHUV01042313.1.p2  ORF type:complete len:106 (+),score=8.25 GHUV01042313.1:1343-1660(+)